MRLINPILSFKYEAPIKVQFHDYIQRRLIAAYNAYRRKYCEHVALTLLTPVSSQAYAKHLAKQRSHVTLTLTCLLAYSCERSVGR